MPAEQATGFDLALLEQPAHLGIDRFGGRFAVRLAATEGEAIPTAGTGVPGRETDGAESGAHTPAGDHLAGQLGSLLHVVLGAGGAGSEHKLLRHAAPHRAHNARVQVLLAVAVAILLRA